jgi:hypothetical protein
MKLLKVILLSFIALADKSQDHAVKLPAKEKFQIFLLAGQSNMAGRGKITAADKVPHPRVLVLSKEGVWKPAVAPLHYDKSAAGVGLGRSFAIALAENNQDITIGLVPAACGGSSISSWVPGGYHGQTKSHPYDDAISRTKTALKSGVLKGILWHQGEGDCGTKRSQMHEKQLTELVKRFRAEFSNPTLPFIIGQLGQFESKPWNEGRKRVDQAQRNVAKNLPYCAFVSSNGLTSNKDIVHFNTKSQHEFGHRYAEAYLLIR